MTKVSSCFFSLSLSPTLFLSPHKLLFLILNQVLSWVSRLGPQMACCSVPSLQEIRKSSWLFRSKVDALTFCLTHRYVKLSFTLLKNASVKNWYFKNNMHIEYYSFYLFPTTYSEASPSSLTIIKQTRLYLFYSDIFDRRTCQNFIYFEVCFCP